MKMIMVVVLVTLFFAVFVEKSQRIFGTSYQYVFAEMDSEVKGEIERSRSLSFANYRSTYTQVYDIEYTYKVEGKEYRNHVVAYEKKNESIDSRLEKYPVGKEVVVHFDSSSPNWSVLERSELSVFVYIQLAVNLLLVPSGTYLIGRYAFDL